MLASSGDATEPCPVPLSLTVTAPSSRMPVRSHFWIRRMRRLSPIRCSTKRTSHFWLTDPKKSRISASRNVVHLPVGDPHHQGIQRIMWSAPGTEPVREPEEVFLVDGVQHHDGSALDELVFQGGDRQRPLPSVRLRYVRPAGRLGPVCSPVDPSVQIFEPRLKLCLVVLPRHAVHAGGGFALERVEHQPERVDVNLVKKRGEPCLPRLPCGVPYAAQRLGHTLPALRPEGALLVRVPLGPRPSLHRLRSRSTGFVRRLRRYYGGV